MMLASLEGRQDPPAEEIRRVCGLFQAAWSDHERSRRRSHGKARTTYIQRVCDAGERFGSDDLTVSKFNQWQQR